MTKKGGGAGKFPPPLLSSSLPAWAAVVVARLEFLARGRAGARRDRRALRRCLRALRARLAEPGGAEAALADFCAACVSLAAAGVAARPDLVGFGPAFARLRALAEVELAGGCDDRPLLRAVEALGAVPDAAFWAAQVLGRAVFLAAVARDAPEVEGEAASMLVNDLAALGRDLPGAALAVASGLRASA